MPDGCRRRAGATAGGYDPAMTDRPIEDDIHELAQQIAAGPDDVAEFAAIHAEAYRERRAMALALLNVDAMIADDGREIDEQHPSLVALRVELRDRLRGLLAWARESGRI
jgi:hypothetical protein